MAGDELVWVPDYRTARGYRVQAQSLFGGEARTIFERATGPERFNVLVNGLTASPAHVLVAERGQRRDGARDDEVFRIGRDGAVEALGDGSDQVARVDMDLSGDIGIYNGSEPGATIRDFREPPSERVLVSPVRGLMRVAERYAAWEDAGDIVVYDRATDSELYRVDGIWPGFDSPRSLDLQADGKVAFLYSPDGNRSELLAWASPAEPFPHRLPVEADRSLTVKLDDDMVVFARNDVRVFNQRLDIQQSFAELGVVNLANGEARMLVRPIVGSFFFDFDGRRLAWQARGCRGVLLRSKSLDELVADPALRPIRASSGCRLRLRGQPRSGRRDRFVRLPVDCTGFGRACFTDGSRFRTLRSYRVDGRLVRRGTRISGRALRPAFTATPRVTLTRLGRRLVRRPGRIRVGVHTIIGDSSVIERRRARVLIR